MKISLRLIVLVVCLQQFNNNQFAMQEDRELILSEEVTGIFILYIIFIMITLYVFIKKAQKSTLNSD